MPILEFVAISFILIKLNEPLQHLIPYEILFYIAQFGLFFLFYRYISPYLGKLTERFCTTTNISIQLITAIYFFVYILI
ncbi:hypothetical protein [Paenibacillus guangzhouensis]|uniref:hypothetical protein n=1 Tax=Paenibacillus guangzhouensis TaxID=1473112 RepID=UPI00126776F9|nr:hypothetical protein [Paenibacillus guangzhouensis]